MSSNVSINVIDFVSYPSERRVTPKEREKSSSWNVRDQRRRTTSVRDWRNDTNVEIPCEVRRLLSSSGRFGFLTDNGGQYVYYEIRVDLTGTRSHTVSTLSKATTVLPTSKTSNVIQYLDETVMYVHFERAKCSTWRRCSAAVRHPEP